MSEDRVSMSAGEVAGLFLKLCVAYAFGRVIGSLILHIIGSIIFPCRS